MPDCSENYENEITNGQNARTVMCKYCNSIILTPGTASFATFEFQLPLVKQKKEDPGPTTESVSLFWCVNDIYTFQNVGFSNTVDTTKYLSCADCECGPIGYYDLTNNKSFVALSRVQHC